MSASDFIQIGVFSVLLATLIAIWLSMRVQNRLFYAQILRDRFEMYRWTYEPVSDEEVHELKVFPEDYMDKTKWKSNYRGNPKAIRKYIIMSHLYEYLAFTYAIRELGLPDPLGNRWVELWTRRLIGKREFIDVHEYYKDFYPDFAKLVEDIKR